jgi:hypothetical protein
MRFGWAGETRAAAPAEPSREVQAWLLGGGDVQRPAVAYLSPHLVPQAATLVRFTAKVENVGVAVPVTVHLLRNGGVVATLLFPQGHGLDTVALKVPLALGDGLDVQVDHALTADDLATVTAAAVAA